MDPGEVCDDHNVVSGDGCRGDCRGTEACGDGLADLGEYCPTHASIDTALAGAFGGAALADADADGDVDVYVVSDAHLLLMRNDGAGGLGAGLDTGAVETGLFADVTGSAEPELIVARGATLDVFPNTAGSFGAAITSTVPTALLARGSFDADTRTDFVVSTGATTCAPLFGDGAGRFTRGTDFTCGAQVRQILVGDVDGDGHDDAVFLHDTATDNVSVAIGDGAGGLVSGAMVTSSFPSLGALGDVDHDGDVDLVHGVMILPVRLEVVRMTAGAPQAPTHVPVTAFPGPVTFVDVDLDGDPDLYNFGFSSGTPYTLLRENDGTGAFTTDLDTAVPRGAQFADMNEDDAIDVVVFTASAVQIFFADP
jgi:cysteine-rich repeat protein